MTLNEAFAEFSNSAGFKEIARLKDSTGSKHRTWLARSKKGQLKAGAIVEILLSNGYEVQANKAKKKK
jgi:hypothetical protein